MTYVINIEDGGGQEFFVTKGSHLVLLSDTGPDQPQHFTVRAMLKRRDQLRPYYPPVCYIYGVELSEFEARRKIVQQEEETRKNGNYSPEATNG